MWIIIRVLIAVIVLSLVEIYFTKKSVRIFIQLIPNVSPKAVKTGVWAFLIFLNLYPVILISGLIYSAIVSQAPSFPESTILNYLIIYPFWILLILVFQLTVYFVIVDILKLLFFPLYKKHRERLRTLEAKISFVLLIFFAVYVPARIIYDYHNIDIRVVEYKKKNLPEDLRGLKITFIADIQADRYTDEARLKKYIDAVNSTNPDLVLIAGDVITSTPKYIQTAAKYLGKIKSRYGTFSCIGDHDNWAYRQDNERSINEIKTALKNYDVIMIDNDIKYIKMGNSKIGITFITNTYASDVSDATLRNLSEINKAEFKIFLTHQPQKFLIDSALKNNYDLFLAGHTHGGQITLLFPFIRLTPTLVETRYIKGDFYFGDMLATVSGGLGMSIAPVRYNSTPEIITITLTDK